MEESKSTKKSADEGKSGTTRKVEFRRRRTLLISMAPEILEQINKGMLICDVYENLDLGSKLDLDEHSFYYYFNKYVLSESKGKYSSNSLHHSKPMPIKKEAAPSRAVTEKAAEPSKVLAKHAQALKAGSEPFNVTKRVLEEIDIFDEQSLERANNG